MAVGKRSRICQRPKRTIFVFGDLFQGGVAGSESVYCSLGLVFSVFFARILDPQKTMYSWQLASRLFDDASGTRKVPWCWRCKVKPSILGSSSALTRTDFVMAFCGCVFGQVQTEGYGGSSGWVWPGKRFGPGAFAWLPKQQLKKRWLRVSWSVLVGSWQTCGGMKRRQRQQWKWRVRTNANLIICILVILLLWFGPASLRSVGVYEVKGGKMHQQEQVQFCWNDWAETVSGNHISGFLMRVAHEGCTSLALLRVAI